MDVICIRLVVRDTPGYRQAGECGTVNLLVNGNVVNPGSAAGGVPHQKGWKSRPNKASQPARGWEFCNCEGFQAQSWYVGSVQRDKA